MLPPLVGPTSKVTSCWGSFVAVGNRVSVGRIVGVDVGEVGVIVGVSVIVGVKVIVRLGVGVNVGVLVGTEAVWVCARAVAAALPAGVAL